MYTSYYGVSKLDLVVLLHIIGPIQPLSRAPYLLGLEATYYSKNGCQGGHWFRPAPPLLPRDRNTLTRSGLIGTGLGVELCPSTRWVAA